MVALAFNPSTWAQQKQGDLWEFDVRLPCSHTVDNGGEGGTTRVSQADEWVNKL